MIAAKVSVVESFENPSSSSRPTTFSPPCQPAVYCPRAAVWSSGSASLVAEEDPAAIVLADARAPELLEALAGEPVHVGLRRADRRAEDAGEADRLGVPGCVELEADADALAGRGRVRSGRINLDLDQVRTDDDALGDERLRLGEGGIGFVLCYYADISKHKGMSN